MPMPRQQRQAPSGNYANAPKNMRNFAQGKKVIPQGLILDEEQNKKNTMHIIKYMQSGRFEDKIREIARKDEKPEG